MHLKTNLLLDVHEDQKGLFDLDKLSHQGIETTFGGQRQKDSYLLLSTRSPRFAQQLDALSETEQKEKLLLYSEESEVQNVLDILGPSNICHLVGKGPYLNSEIITNIKKLEYSNFSGIEKNLKEDAQIKSTHILHSKDINDEFTNLLNGLSFNQFFETPIDYLRVIYNELATNAFHHTEEAHEAQRSDSVFLSPEKAVEVKIGIDKERVILSIKDQMGELTREKVLASIERGFKERTPKTREKGAGLGLYMVYNHANQVILNTKKNDYSEIMAVIEANKRYLNYKKRVTSFHYFECQKR